MYPALEITALINWSQTAIFVHGESPKSAERRARLLVLRDRLPGAPPFDPKRDLPPNPYFMWEPGECVKDSTLRDSLLHQAQVEIMRNARN